MSQPLHPEAHPPRGYATILWVILALTSALDALLVVSVAQTHGRYFWWWLIQKSHADPLVAIVTADWLLLRLGIFMFALRFFDFKRIGNLTRWSIFVPLIGAPMLFAGLLAAEGTAETEKTGAAIDN